MVQAGVRTRALIVFARYPKVGLVKTRLAAGVGAQKATELYKLFVKKILEESTRCSDTTACVALAAPVEQPLLQEWLLEMGQSEVFQIVQQSASQDLGDRMLKAMQDAMQAGASQVVLVGSDIPDLDASILMQAYEALERHEIVFGPAQDGGFYLIGAKRLHEHLFQDITWSTSKVLENAVGQAKRCGLDVADSSMLPCLRDIDTAEDLEQWISGVDRDAFTSSQMLEVAEDALQHQTNAGQR